MTNQPNTPKTRVTSHARRVHDTAQAVPVSIYPTTLENIAPAGQWHLHAKYRGLRYYLISDARGYVIDDLASGLQKILPPVVSLYLTDRRGSTTINGDAQILRSALVAAHDADSVKLATFDSLLGTRPVFSSDQASAGACTEPPAQAVPANLPRPLFDIARDIYRLWRGKDGVSAINYAARPYLQAMLELRGPQDVYGADSATSIIRYFLSNATTWRGADAVRIKNELRAHLGEKPVQPRLAAAKRV